MLPHFLSWGGCSCLSSSVPSRACPTRGWALFFGSLARRISSSRSSVGTWSCEKEEGCGWRSAMRLTKTIGTGVLCSKLFSYRGGTGSLHVEGRFQAVLPPSSLRMSQTPYLRCIPVLGWPVLILQGLFSYINLLFCLSNCKMVILA